MIQWRKIILFDFHHIPYPLADLGVRNISRGLGKSCDQSCEKRKKKKDKLDCNSYRASYRTQAKSILQLRIKKNKNWSHPIRDKVRCTIDQLFTLRQPTKLCLPKKIISLLISPQLFNIIPGSCHAMTKTLAQVSRVTSLTTYDLLMISPWLPSLNKISKSLSP